ncbi:YdcF family protein [Scrofimicrobium sp. R131]|uniref:YdcF family protein n=1 Tax=Scrofimicrobium appendicitidis TaxID=3079930 RepID=A0AAU7V6Z3_9ACTO
MSSFYFPFLDVLLLLIVAVVLTVRDPRRIKCAIIWGVTVNYALFSLVMNLGDYLARRTDEAAGWLLVGMFSGLLLAIVVLAVILLSFGVRLIRRESFSLAHSLALLLGAGILAYLAAAVGSAAVGAISLLMLLLLLGIPLGYLSFVLISYLIYSRLYARWVRRFAGRANAIVVLGSGLQGDQLTPLLKARLNEAVTRFRQAERAGRRPVLVASGGQGPGETIPEGVAMARYLHEAGVEPVRVEDRSTTTEENLRFSWQLLGGPAAPTPWLAVSSDYHAFRAALLLRELGIPGHALGAPTPNYFWASAILREFVAILRLHLKLNVAVLLVLSLPALVTAIMLAVSLV